MADVKKLKIDGTNYDVKIPSENVKLMTGYSKGSSTNAITPSDSLNSAIGKLECRADANQVNVLYGLNTGVKNIIDFSTGEITLSTPSVTTHSVTWTIADNKGVVANGTSDSSGSYPSITKLTLPVGTYKMSGGTSRIRFQCGNIVDSGSGATLTVNENTTQPVSFIVYAIPNTTFSNETIYPMLCTEEAWNQSHDYMPPALPNYDLTRLEAEDRNALIEQVDSGAKNILEIPDTTIDTNGVRFVCNKANGTVVVSGGTSSSTSAIALLWGTASNYIPNTYGGMVISDNSNNTDSDMCLYIAFSNNGTSQANSAKIYGNRHYVIPSASEFPYLKVLIYVGYGKTLSNSVTVKPMICAKAAYDVSQKYVPYAMTNYELTQYTDGLKISDTLKTSGSLDDIKYTSFLKATSDVVGKPEGITSSCIVRTSFPMNDRTGGLQEIWTPGSSSAAYYRVCWGSQWGPWVRLN